MTSTFLSESVHFFPYLSRNMLQAVHLPLDYPGKSQQLAQSFNCSSVLLILKSFRMQSAHPHSKPCGLQAPEPSNLFTSRLGLFFLYYFLKKKAQAIFLLFATHSYASVSHKKQMECENTNSRLGQIHTNVTVNIQNIMCHCFSPPTPQQASQNTFHTQGHCSGCLFN